MEVSKAAKKNCILSRVFMGTAEITLSNTLCAFPIFYLNIIVNVREVWCFDITF